MLRTWQIPFVREYRVKFEKAPRAFARIDFFWECSDIVILFECDEYAHANSNYPIRYECLRMWLVYQDFLKRGRTNVHFIRYNPNNKIDPRERDAAIRNAINYTPSGFAITYLYYRMEGVVPRVALSPEYTLKEYIHSDSSQTMCGVCFYHTEFRRC